MNRDSISGESHVSMKQSMLQSLMSLWKEILDPELVYFIVQRLDISK
jgi:hypothetical protein